jgi:hypothetical protein
MQTTYTIASENGNMAIVCTNTYEDGSFVSWKHVANKDGTFVAFRRNDRHTGWRKFSWGDMAAKRFSWAKTSAAEYFA